MGEKQEFDWKFTLAKNIEPGDLIEAKGGGWDLVLAVLDSKSGCLTEGFVLFGLSNGYDRILADDAHVNVMRLER